MLKQTAGVSFSAAGMFHQFIPVAVRISHCMRYEAVSTCLWRGVYVRDILLASGLQDQPETERWYVNFEGRRYTCSILPMRSSSISLNVNRRRRRVFRGDLRDFNPSYPCHGRHQRRYTGPRPE